MGFSVSVFQSEVGAAAVVAARRDVAGGKIVPAGIVEQPAVRVGGNIVLRDLVIALVAGARIIDFNS